MSCQGRESRQHFSACSRQHPDSKSSQEADWGRVCSQQPVTCWARRIGGSRQLLMMSSFTRYIHRLQDETTDQSLRQSKSFGPDHNNRPSSPIRFPDKGAKGKNPAHLGNFYSTKLRDKLVWWIHPSNNCPKRLLKLLQHGVKVNEPSLHGEFTHQTSAQSGSYNSYNME